MFDVNASMAHDDDTTASALSEEEYRKLHDLLLGDEQELRDIIKKEFGELMPKSRAMLMIMGTRIVDELPVLEESLTAEERDEVSRYNQENRDINEAAAAAAAPRTPPTVRVGAEAAGPPVAAPALPRVPNGMTASEVRRISSIEELLTCLMMVLKRKTEC